MFLAWFNQEKDKPLAEIERNLRLIVDRKVRLLVSAVSYAEVLDKAGESTAGTEFRGFVKRPNVIVADLDARVGDVAASIRSAGLLAHSEGSLKQAVKIPDAFIAATAVFYRAAVLYTFDPILLAISQWDAVNGLPIMRPQDRKTPLGF